MLKLCNRNSFEYDFVDEKGERIHGTGYRFEFYSEDFVGTISAKVNKEIFDRFDELKNDLDRKFLLGVSKEHRVYLKCII